MAKKKKKEISIIRSSAAEYLTFITATGKSDVNAIYFDENVLLTQKMMGLLYNIEPHTINYHLKKIFSDGELEEQAVIRKFRITASDGKNYNTNHYNLKAIIAAGNKVDSPRAVQFRKWANGIIEEFTIKGFTMDDERLKNFGTVLTKDYFEEQLERIREIRLSERRFYQKITDIYATSIDYDPKAQTTRVFFAKVQNQLHWAIHGETFNNGTDLRNVYLHGSQPNSPEDEKIHMSNYWIILKLFILCILKISDDVETSVYVKKDDENIE